MRVGIVVLMVLSLILGIVIGRGIDFGAARQPEQVSPVSTDAGLSAEMMRKGEESFGRSRYGEAREYFHKAILADPASTNGWSWYDLALIYTIAEQFKDHGEIVESTAPAPESTAALSPEPVQEPDDKTSEQTAGGKVAPEVNSTAPAKATKEISNPSGKAEEPAEKASVAPESAPAVKAQPAPAPTPLPPAGGVKSPKEKEGC